MKYKGPQTKETKLGINAHTDKNIVPLILYQNQVDGLQVETKAGKWINDKPSSPHSFIAMIGDSLYAWTNGRLRSPYYREGYITKAPEEVVDEEHPLLFKPFDHVEFLGFYYTEAGQLALST
ncbi:hypothetical protein ACFX11_025384 [Malus domestica]